MKKVISVISILVLIFNCLPLSGQVISEADNAIVEKIKAANIQYASITSDFKQIKHLPFVEGDVISSGKFFYVKPDRLAMKYSEPAGELMLINGDKFYMLAAGKISKTSAKSNSKMRKMKTILAACLQGDVKQMDYRKISCKENGDVYEIVVEINEKAKKGVISKVSVSYAKTDLTPAILKTEEPDGSYTVYELTARQLNQKPGDEVFQEPKKSGK